MNTRSSAFCSYLMALLVATSVVSTSGCKKAREWAEKKAEERREARREAEAVHANEPAPIIARPDGPGLPPGVYKLVEVRAEALPTDRKGKPWDGSPGEEPDIEIVIRLDGERIGRCEAGMDTLLGRCKLSREVRIDGASRLELEVFDADPGFDDVVGAATLTEPSRWGLGMALPMLPSGRLRAATIVFERPTPWWDVYRDRLLGFGGGIVLALGVIGTWRRSLMPPPPPPAPVPRCQYCEAVLAANATTCASCGGVQKGASS